MTRLPDACYQPRYCEENAWHLCQHHALAAAEPHVIVVSNAQHGVAMWLQRAAPVDRPIAWDYHVFVMARTAGWQVWDYDTRLDMPVAVADYLDASFATVGLQPARFDPRFRIMTAADYRDLLRTDRRHMRRSDGSWHAPPPPWPLISEPAEGSNLDRITDMTDELAGELVDLLGLRARFCT